MKKSEEARKEPRGGRIRLDALRRERIGCGVWEQRVLWLKLRKLAQGWSYPARGSVELAQDPWRGGGYSKADLGTGKVHQVKRRGGKERRFAGTACTVTGPDF